MFETFRGISHLLMEKVTKDLRRAPTAGSNQRPSAPVEAAEPTASREMSRPSAPPVAPVQSIQHEAHSTPAAITGGDETRIDYGREIELPGTVPVGHFTAPTPSSASIPAPVPAPLPVTVASVAPFASSAGAPHPAPQAFVAPVPAASAEPAPLPAVVPSHEDAPSSSSAPSLAPSATAAPVVEARVKASSDGGPTPLVVPIRLQKGGTYEIVIRLTVEDH